MIKPTKLFFLLVITFISAFLMISCNSEQPKIENVCTLTTEQLPEIRGLRIGMSFDELLKKYPKTCNLNAPLINTDFKGRFEISANSEDKIKDCITYANGKLDFIFAKLSVNDYPELKGISQIEFTFTQTRISWLSFEYEPIQEEAKNLMVEKMKESLGLSNWTNWESTTSWLDGKMYINNLNCNKIRIAFLMKEEDRSFMDKKNFIYHPILRLLPTDDVAMTENQKLEFEKQKHTQEQSEREKKIEEERKKLEDFKP